MPRVSYEEWHYWKDGEQCGPVSTVELRKLLSEQRVDGATLVRADGSNDWVPIGAAEGVVISEIPLPALSAQGLRTLSYANPRAATVRDASFVQRGGALLMDVVVLHIIGVSFGGLLLMMNVGGRTLEDFAALIVLLALWAYYAFMESSPCQGTVGKLVVGIKVTDVHGARISFPRATGRFFAKILSALPLYTGFLLAAFADRRQALHDMLAGTVVMRR
jgi:uncharacterized RDD family membrane protein YckC